MSFEGVKMAFFLLRPLNIQAPDWALSLVRSPVQVNADEEAQARHAAAEQLCSPRDLPFPLSSSPRPWLRRDRAECLPLQAPDPEFPLIEGYHPQRRRGRPSKQHLFLLTPMSLDSPHWELSTSTETVYVSARNSAHARAIAALHFDIRGSNDEDEGLVHPWWNPRLVSVVEVSEVPPGMRLIRSHDRVAAMSLRMRPKG
jgi:hypothetical protein